MPLPILHTPADRTPEDLVRLFHRTELHWMRHVGEEAQLDGGVAITNPELAAVDEANSMIDAALAPEISAAEVVEEAARHFKAAGTACRQWLFNPSAPPARIGPLADHLVARGWSPEPYDIMHLGVQRTGGGEEPAGLTIIPARASFRHARALAEVDAAECNVPALEDASMLHLDDPHWDVSIALLEGRAVARAGVLAVGDVGRIEHLFVAPSFRRKGIGRTMARRALEVCARSLFKHVMVCVPPDASSAVALYTSLGFRRIGQIVPYRLPAG